MSVAYCHDGHEYLVGDGYCHKCRIAELEQQPPEGDAAELIVEQEKEIESLRRQLNIAKGTPLAEHLMAEHKAAQQPPVGDEHMLHGSHKAVTEFWRVWQDVGEPHKHGIYESTWMAFAAAIRAALKEGEG